MMNAEVLPWFSNNQVPVLRVLTDRGTEYCGKIDSHAYQLYLGIENIDHSRTKAYSPQTNGIIERFHKTMKNEFYDVAFRRKLYRSLEELQQDVDLWIKEYNDVRPHSGKYCYGKTPMQTFIESKPLATSKNIDNNFTKEQNTLEPDKTETGSLETVGGFVGIAPPDESNNTECLHGANQNGLEKQCYLSDNFV